MKMWRRSGTTGSSTPAIAATWPAHGPAALTTARVAIGPADVVDAGDAPLGDVDAGEVGAAQHGDPPAQLRRLHEAHGDAVRIGDAVGGAEGGRAHAGGVEPRRHRRRVAGREPLHVEAEPPLQRDAVAEGPFARLARQQEQVAVLPEVDRAADLGFEAGEEGDRLARQRDVGGIGELVAHAAGVAPGGAGAELGLALDQHDLAGAVAGQVVGGGRAHAAAADDHHIRRAHRRPSYHPAGAMLRPPVTPAGVRSGGGPCARP